MLKHSITEMAKTMLNKIVSKSPDSPLLSKVEHIKPPQIFHDFSFKEDLSSLDSLNKYLENHSYTLEDYLSFYRSFLLDHYFKKLPILNFPETPKVSQLLVSPDNQFLALLTNNSNFSFYNIQYNFLIPPLTLLPTSHEILAICFDEDNDFLFTGGTDNLITAWDIRILQSKASGTVAKSKTYTGHENYISCLAYSHQALASGSYDRTVRLWTKEKECRICSRHKEKVVSVSFSKGIKFLASGSTDFTIKIWNIQEGVEEKVLLGHNQEITSVSFSPIEIEKLVSSGLDMSVRLWDIGIKRNKVLFQGQAVENVDNARFSFDGAWIIAVIDNKDLIFWSAAREIQERRITIEVGFLTNYAFSRDNKRLYYSDVKQIHCVKLKSLQEVQKKFIRQTGSIQDFFLSRKGKLIVWDHNKVYVYENTKRGYRLKSHLPQSIGISSFSLKATITQNEEFLAISSDLSIDVYGIIGDFEEFKLIKRISIDHSMHKKLRTLLFSKTAQFLAASFHEKILVFNQNSFKSLSQLVRIKGSVLNLPKNTTHISCITFSHNEQFLAGGLNPNLLVIWSLSNLNIIKNFVSNTYSITCLTFTENDEKLITGTKENLILIWDISTELEEKKFVGHLLKIRNLATSPSGLNFSSSGKDKIIKLWNISTGQEIKSYGPFSEKPQGLIFSLNDKKLLTCVDKTLMNFKQMSYIAYTQIKIVCEILRDNENLKTEELLVKYPRVFSYTSIKDLILYREIYPYNITIFHYLSYFQLEKSLEIILNLCKFHKIIPRFSIDQSIIYLNKFPQTPLSIAMNLNNIAIMHLFIKALKQYSFGPGCCPSITIQILSKLIEYEPSYVSELLESRFCEPYGEIPRTYWEFEEPLQASLNLIVVKENDIETHLLNKRTEAIKKTFKKTLLKNEPIHKKCRNCCKRRINLNKAVKLQSQPEFIKSLEVKMLDLPGIIDPDNDESFFIKTHELDSDNPLFGSRVFLAIIQYKWDTYARDYFLREAFIYLLYLIILLVNSLYLFPKKLADSQYNPHDFSHLYSMMTICFDSILFIFCLWFLLKEFLSINKLRWRYFLDLDNYMDISALFFLTTLLIHDLGDSFGYLVADTADMRIYHSGTLFLASLRFLSFARGFEAMAFMIRLIIQVTIDMSYFLIIMFFITCSLAFSGFLLQNKREFSIFESFNSFYRLILGDFEGFDEISQNSVAFSLVWVSFLIGTLIIMIVMLNLLISIISDTYGKVSGMNKLANAYEKTGIIIEIEKKFSLKKKNKLRMKGFFQKYLYVGYCRDLKEREEEEKQELEKEEKKNEFDEREIIQSLENIEREIHKIASFKEKFEEFAEKCLKNQEMYERKINAILEGNKRINN